MPDPEDTIIARMKAAEFAGVRIAPKDENDAPFPTPTEAPSKDGLSNYDMAYDFKCRNAHRFLYVEGDQWWECKDGCVWVHSSHERVKAAVQRYLVEKRMAGEVNLINSTKIRDIQSMAASEFGPVDFSTFDCRAKDWLPMANGIYDLTQGDIIPHSPHNRITRKSPFTYDPLAECPRWMQHLSESLIDRSGNTMQEWVDAMQLWFGYCLVPDNRLQTAMFWTGQGGNGKGVATRVLEQLVGTSSTIAVPVAQLHEEYHRAALRGKLVGFVNEPDANDMNRNGNHFKAISGGDQIQARNPGEKVFTFTPFIRLVVSCNNLPSTKDLSKGYFRRITLIEWRNNVDNDKSDSHLDEKLTLELPGIFNWALEGLMKLRNDPAMIITSVESKQLLEEYKTDEDAIGRFIAENYEKTKSADDKISSASLFSEYRKWCEETGEYRSTQKKLGARLRSLGFPHGIVEVNGVKFNAWRGIKQLWNSVSKPPTTNDQITTEFGE